MNYAHLSPLFSIFILNDCYFYFFVQYLSTYLHDKYNTICKIKKRYQTLLENVERQENKIWFPIFEMNEVYVLSVVLFHPFRPPACAPEGRQLTFCRFVDRLIRRCVTPSRSFIPRAPVALGISPLPVPPSAGHRSRLSLTVPLFSRHNLR
jgi:hypothetical protein